MDRSLALILAVAAPLLVHACSNYAGDDLLKTSSNGKIAIPTYEASAPMVFDASFEGGFDAESDGAVEAEAPDAAADAAVDAADAGPEGCASDAPGDAPADATKG